jgi:hypothetical protein
VGDHVPLAATIFSGKPMVRRQGPCSGSSATASSGSRSASSAPPSAAAAEWSQEGIGVGIRPRVAVQLVLEEGVEVGRGLRRQERREGEGPRDWSSGLESAPNLVVVDGDKASAILESTLASRP